MLKTEYIWEELVPNILFMVANTLESILMKSGR